MKHSYHIMGYYQHVKHSYHIMGYYQRAKFSYNSHLIILKGFIFVRKGVVVIKISVAFAR